jgi:hypothetical protein
MEDAEPVEFVFQHLADAFDEFEVISAGSARLFQHFRLLGVPLGSVIRLRAGSHFAGRTGRFRLGGFFRLGLRCRGLGGRRF